MATFLKAQVAEDRCRERVADASANYNVWTPDQMMHGLDDALNSIWTEVRLNGRDRLLERLDVLPASFTLEGSNIRTYELPAWAGPVRKVEGLGVTGSTPREIEQAELDFKDWSQSSWTGPAMVWFRSQTGTISILGDITRFSTIRFWFHRRWPPMHYGATSGLGTTTTMLFSTSPIGDVVRRDVYQSTLVEFTAGSLAGTIVRITAFNPATLTATFTPALSGAVPAAQAYSLIVPVDPEHGNYVVEEMAAQFLERSGNANYIAAKNTRLIRLRENFISDLIHQDQAAPPTVYSHR